MKYLIAIALLAPSSVAAHDLPPHTYIDPVCFWKAPAIEGQIVIAAVRQPKWDHRGGRHHKWLICYNGILVMTGKTEAKAWSNWVKIDLVPRLQRIEKRARETQELSIGGDIWQYQ